MKKKLFSILTLFAITVFALAEMKVYVYKKDGTKVEYIAANVDSIGFVNVTSGNENGHEWVDLGLPSGTKWATCNVGATTPEEYGTYFAWGETESNKTKTIFNINNYKWYSGGNIIKYCTSSREGNVDNIEVLEKADDVASVSWGGKWRMPTDNDFKELRNNCTGEWKTINGVKGYLVIGINNNSIFLPAAGCYKGQMLYNSNSYGYYWTSSLYTSDSRYAIYRQLTSSAAASYSSEDRAYGFSVRSVF